jgi:hypothetical protein
MARNQASKRRQRGRRGRRGRRGGGALGPGHDGVTDARRLVEGAVQETCGPGAGGGLVLERAAAEVEAATEVFDDCGFAEAGDVLEFGGGEPGVSAGRAHGWGEWGIGGVME